MEENMSRSEESIKKVSRRKFVALTGGALITSALLAACGDNPATTSSVTTAPSSGTASTTSGAAESTTTSPAATGSGVTLEYWAWILGSKESVDLWNQTHTNFKVNYTQTTAGVPHYNRVKAAVAAGSGGPDLAQVGLEFVNSLVVAGVLQPITKEVAAYKDTFIDWTIQEVTLGGDTYAIPQDIGPMAMFYRKDIFDQYSIIVPKTWDEYKAAAEKIHAADPTRYIAQFSPAEVFQFAGYAWANKAKWFGIKGNAWQININGAETKKVADFWQDLITRKLVKDEAYFNAGWYKD
jgi:multiple sugar transport system substrate-binding protein